LVADVDAVREVVVQRTVFITRLHRHKNMRSSYLLRMSSKSCVSDPRGVLNA
jgi:hypothetical protein